MKKILAFILLLTLPAVAADHYYSTSFPATENPISQGGIWRTGATIGLDWHDPRTTGGFPGLVFGSQTGSTPPPFTDSVGVLTGTWSANQKTEATVHMANPVDGTQEEVEFFLRGAVNAHSITGYEMQFGGNKVTSSQCYTDIVRWNGALNSFASLGFSSGSQFCLHDGDVISATVTGQTPNVVLTLYINGVQVKQVTDGVSGINSGNPGIGFYVEHISGANCPVATPNSCNADFGFKSYTALDNTYAPWLGIVSPLRASDWANAGVQGGIPSAAWTQCGSTISAGASSTTIQNAINACTPGTLPANGKYVLLAAGAFPGLGGINLKQGVVLRGLGANQTFLTFTGTASCQGQFGAFCAASTDVNWKNGPTNLVNWTAGYSKGSRFLTLASVPNLKIGNPVILDQNDTTCDDGGIIVSQSTSTCTPTSSGISGPYSLQGNGGGWQRSGRSQTQVVTVAGCNGSTTVGASCSGTNTVVTIDQPLYMPNWASGNTPQAWWATSPIQWTGIENMSVDVTSAGATSFDVSLFNAQNVWVTGVRSIDSGHAHVEAVYTNRMTLRDSYMFLTQNSVDQSYGFECGVGSDNLVENNIFQAVSGPLTMSSCPGTVLGYNFGINDYYTASAGFINAMSNAHEAGTDSFLYEGNIGAQFYGDVFHGTHNLLSYFRNWSAGNSPLCYASGASYATATFSACSSNQVPIIFLAFSRGMNVIGNVLGQSGIQNGYTSGSKPIFSLNNGASSAGVTVPTDTNVTTTSMRWGNYDVFNASNRFVSSEVPTGLTGAQALFANAVPPNNTLPASFYYSSQPSWWPSGKAWPLIGPDISTGNVIGCNGGTFSGGWATSSGQCTGGSTTAIVASRVISNPAMDCFLASGGRPDGIGGPITFNAASCYGTPVNPNPPPTAPATAIQAKFTKLLNPFLEAR